MYVVRCEEKIKRCELPSKADVMSNSRRLRVRSAAYVFEHPVPLVVDRGKKLEIRLGRS